MDVAESMGFQISDFLSGSLLFGAKKALPRWAPAPEQQISEVYQGAVRRGEVTSPLP
jgi:hypothetical protein